VLILSRSKMLGPILSTCSGSSNVPILGVPVKLGRCWVLVQPRIIHVFSSCTSTLHGTPTRQRKVDRPLPDVKRRRRAGGQAADGKAAVHCFSQ
jgi:hypothetical protein